jgi:hypothetical protein
MEIEVDQAQLAEQLNAAFAGRPLVETLFGPASVGQVSIELREGEALASGQVQAGFLSLPVTVTATADVEAGRPLVRVQDIAVSGMPLPDAARQGVEATIQAEVDRALAQQSFRVEAVTIQPGKLTVRGQPA